MSRNIHEISQNEKSLITLIGDDYTDYKYIEK